MRVLEWGVSDASFIDCVESLFEIPSGYGSDKIVSKVNDVFSHVDRFPFANLFPLGPRWLYKNNKNMSSEDPKPAIEAGECVF